MNELRIRHSNPEDLPRIMEVYSYARKFMAEHGNPRQWGLTGWPPEEVIRKDIETGKSYVCVCIHEADSERAKLPVTESDIPHPFERSGDRIVGTFYFDSGIDIEPTYRQMEEGTWIGDNRYGVVHRIASDGSIKGTGSFCINWAYSRCGHLRMDTHPDNRVMQNLLTKLGFVKCGTIHVEEDSDPRYAYEKVMRMGVDSF